jgi:hypothetical protein
MRKILLVSVIAPGLLLGAALPASALTVPLLPNSGSAPAVTLVSGGCGHLAHRDPWGVCRPNRVIAWHRKG